MAVSAPDPTELPKTDLALGWTLVFGLSIPLLFLVGAALRLPGSVLPYTTGAATAMCAFLAVARLPRPRKPSVVLASATLGALAGLAPMALIVFFRLSYRSCAVLNVLGLPWPEPFREIIHWTAGLIWLASTVGLTIALKKLDLRRPAVALWIWSGVIAFPTFILLFLTVYGDPAAGCIAV